jgi:hypothetical protein
MMAALIRGATIDTILSGFVCEGSPHIRDALVIPGTLDDALVRRLGRTPDELHRNWLLFHFLSFRASEAVFTRTIEQSPDLLYRSCWQTELVGDDPKIAVHARAFRLGVLQDDLRLEAADRLESAALTDFDLSFFDDEARLALMPSLRLVGLGLALRTMMLPSLEDRIDEIADDADLSEEPESHFDKLLGMLDRLEAIGVDTNGSGLIDAARAQVERAVDTLVERKRERDEEVAEGTDWTHIVTQKQDKAAPFATPTNRSVFDDVDK